MNSPRPGSSLQDAALHDMEPDEADPPAPPDPAELKRAIAALLPELRGFARFLVRDRVVADDLVQEAIVRALSSLAQFVAQTSLRNWLFTILRHAHYEQSRRRRTEQRVLADYPMMDEAGAPAQQGHAEIGELQRFLWTLPPALREALVLVGAQGLSYAEAASICEVPEGTVKARVSRARRLLAERMTQGHASLEPAS